MGDAGATQEQTLDGRSARRARGRLATIDAVIDLIMEGDAPTTANQIAHRAGIGVASVYRYFETIEDLHDDAIQHYFDRFSDLFEVPNVGVGPLEARIARLAAARDQQHATTLHVARRTRSQAYANDKLAATLKRLRLTQADQLRLHFAAELTHLTPAASEDLIVVISTMTSFESWDQLHADHDRSSTQIRRSWSTALRTLLH